ncbi:duf28 domain-containing protein [Xylariaceae sp. FL0594]|nr:duf28 domain-containing protein [Xylariaceae sp. FL0594]
MSSLFSLSPILSRRIPPSSPTRSLCAQCRRRSLTSSAALGSGHNKWSKIKHDKAAKDKKTTQLRSQFAKKLTLYTKLYGPNPDFNSQLANLIAIAKKAGMPKSNIDTAIARGQGKSDTGEGLSSATLEVMMPPSIALVIDIETDNKTRSLGALRATIKKYGGIVTPTAFLFARRGRVVLSNPDKEKDFDDVMMQALDAGAEDVEKDDEGDIVVWTQPNMTHQVAQDLAKNLGLEISSSDIIWSCTSDRAKVNDTETAENLKKLIQMIREEDNVQAVYINAERGDISEEEWSGIREALEE